MTVAETATRVAADAGGDPLAALAEAVESAAARAGRPYWSCPRGNG